MGATSNIPPRIRQPFPWRTWAGALLGAVTAGTALFLVDPARQHYFPPCLFHQLTGWWCPGCGGTRAVHQLLHGHVATAFFLNPLFVTALPFLAYWLLRLAVAQMTGHALPFFRWQRAWGWGLGLAVVIFFVARNVPIPGLLWLRL